MTTELPLLEDFYTLQGEGFYTGKAAYFVRLCGCDIGCAWCDSKLSWSYQTENLVQVKDIVAKAASFPAKAVVVTGGEPLSYDLDYLCEELQIAGVQTFVETSGAYKLSGSWNWICLSPKKQNPPQEEIFEKANELKVIIFDETGFQWAEENAAKVSPDCKLYLQPEWSKHKTLIPEIVEYVKNNPKWSISLQSHKFMKIP